MTPTHTARHTRPFPHKLPHENIHCNPLHQHRTPQHVAILIQTTTYISHYSTVTHVRIDDATPAKAHVETSSAAHDLYVNIYANNDTIYPIMGHILHAMYTTCMFNTYIFTNKLYRTSYTRIHVRRSERVHRTTIITAYAHPPDALQNRIKRQDLRGLKPSFQPQYLSIIVVCDHAHNRARAHTRIHAHTSIHACLFLALSVIPFFLFVYLPLPFACT